MPGDQEEQKVLINFLYKDKNLACSFCAQIFTGLIREFHKEDQKGYSELSKLGGGVKLVAEAKTEEVIKEEGQITTKEILEPHDTTYLDLLNYLTPYLSENIEKANHGDLIKAKGELLVLGHNIVKAGLEAFSILLKQNPKALGLSKQGKKELGLIQKLFNMLINSSQSFSRYILFSDQGQITGYLQEEFLTEPLETITFKYGHRPIPNVILIGIKEKPSNHMLEFSSDTIEGAIYEIAKAFATFLPQGDYLVKPLFIYYPTYLVPCSTMLF